MKTKKILVVDDESSMRLALSESLESCGYTVETSGSGADGLEKFRENKFDVVITDMRMPKMGGMAVLKGIKNISAVTPVIVITAYGTVNTAVQAMKEGAADFLMKPFSVDHLEAMVKKVVAQNHTDTGKQATPDSHVCPSGKKKIITRDPAMRGLLKLAKSISNSKSSALIQGESGTGKELMARYIHRHSARAGMPFVAVNCAAIPHNLLESVMFGHEKGAFTGALQRQLGKFEIASGGTLLLDEISEMDIGLQAKLLRVIQESELDRVGGRDTVPVDVRIIATTNADLKDYIAENRFRSDLYYRLNVIPIKIPPLRERKQDIVYLYEYFMEKYSLLNEMSVPTLSPEAAERLNGYDWPGNVREMENVVERAILLSCGEVIQPEHLCLEGETDNRQQPNQGPLHDPCLKNITLKEMERKLIFETLDDVKGNRTRASEILGVSVRTIRNKLSEYKETREGQYLTGS
jgi:DNA-binding NtrC family response regulator